VDDAVKKGSVLEEEEPRTFVTIGHLRYGLAGAGAVPPAGAFPVAGAAGVNGMVLFAFGVAAGAVAGAGVNA
jgi:hypothetical protein